MRLNFFIPDFADLPFDSFAPLSDFKLIPQTAQGYYKFSVLFQVGTQHLYMCVYRSVISVKVKAPHVHKQFFARESNALILYEIE